MSSPGAGTFRAPASTAGEVTEGLDHPPAGATAGDPARNDPAPGDAAPGGGAAADRADQDARKRVVAVVGLIVAAAIVGGVLALLRPATTSASSDWAGTVLGVEQPKPEVVLTDTSGNPFDLARDTPRPLTLLMFGYTNCPDVCPISLSTLASALEALGPEVAKKVQMVFVSVDPERDTPERLREYLDQFDPRFVGLTGTPEELARAQELANVPQAFLDDPDEDGSYEVGHASQMIAYQEDGLARIVYPFGTREGDWVSDLPRLLAGELPS